MNAQNKRTALLLVGGVLLMYVASVILILLRN